MSKHVEIASDAPAREGAGQVLAHASMLALSLGPRRGKSDAGTSFSSRP